MQKEESSSGTPPAESKEPHSAEGAPEIAGERTLKAGPNSGVKSSSIGDPDAENRARDTEQVEQSSAALPSEKAEGGGSSPVQASGSTVADSVPTVGSADRRADLNGKVPESISCSAFIRKKKIASE